ncbi:hypothetical protein LguiB_033607 [Lonicera macranthoides]
MDELKRSEAFNKMYEKKVALNAKANEEMRLHMSRLETFKEEEKQRNIHDKARRNREVDLAEENALMPMDLTRMSDQQRELMKSIKRMFAKQSTKKADESGLVMIHQGLTVHDVDRHNGKLNLNHICTPSGETITLPFEREATNLNIPPAMSFSRAMYIDAMTISNQLREILLVNTTEMSRQLRDKDAEIEISRGTGGYRPTTNFDEDATETFAKLNFVDVFGLATPESDNHKAHVVDQSCDLNPFPLMLLPQWHLFFAPLVQVFGFIESAFFLLECAFVLHDYSFLVLLPCKILDVPFFHACLFAQHFVKPNYFRIVPKIFELFQVKHFE